MAQDYISVGEKLERAVQQLLRLRIPADSDRIYTSGFSDRRVLPNRTVYVPMISNIVAWRMEGICHLKVMHTFSAVVQPNEDLSQRRMEREAIVAATIGALSQGDNQSLEATAYQITLAGRDLAVPNSSLTGAAAVADALIAQQNADMANFRCDEVVFGEPFLDRGHRAADATNWGIDLNFVCRCSFSTGDSN